MGQKVKPTFLNYMLPLIMIAIGARQFAKHGPGLGAILPIVLGLFALYLVLFNRDLMQKIETLIIKLWFPVGQLITGILLTVTFFLIFAPIGLLLRLFKKDILNRKFKVDRRSYWIERPQKQENNYTQQF